MRILVACLLLIANGAWSQKLNMRFKGGSIIYDLEKGRYNVQTNGAFAVQEAYAAAPGLKSSNLPFVKHTVKKISDGFGKGKLHIIDRGQMQQLFYIYNDKPWFLTQIRSVGAANYSAPLIGRPVWYRSDHARALVVPFDNDMWIRYEIQHPEKANYTSSEVTAVFDDYFGNGLVIGSVEHTVWKSGLQFKNGNLEAFGGFTDSILTHDKLQHGKVGDSVCTSPRFMIGYFENWKDGMQQYAAVNKAAEPPAIQPWARATPMGWNSWGVLQTKLDLQKAKSVIDFFADSCKGFRNADSTLYIDLDSYWDNLKENELREFVSYCKSKHFVPGIYWAPFADWGKRDSSTWVKQNGNPVDLDGAYAMDPTHPQTKERMRRFVSRFRNWGFEMIKVDFLGHAALESDRFYDASTTTGMQAYKQGMEYLDSLLDGRMLVYAAISPTMATGRYVHMRRIACDAFSAIGNTEYTLNSTGYGWWQSHLYQYVDADHVVFRTDSFNVNNARFLSAIVTGTLITGDDFSTGGRWSKVAQQLLQNKALLSVIADGKPFQPVVTSPGKGAPVAFTKQVGAKRLLAIFNYSDSAQLVTLRSEHFGVRPNSPVSIKDLSSGAIRPAKNYGIQTSPASASIYEVVYPAKMNFFQLLFFRTK